MRKVVIIGNGISGITAAVELRKRSQDHISVVSEEGDYFFSRPGLMYVYMGHLKFEHLYPYERGFWAKHQLQLVQKTVTKILPPAKQVVCADGTTLPFDVLIIASGSKPNKFAWPGKDLPGVTGLYHRQDLDRLELWSAQAKHAVIVGGGLIGIELAEMFLSRNIRVTFLVREKSFWDIVLPAGESQLLNRHIREHGIDLRLETGLAAILPGKHGNVASVETSGKEVIPCDLVGLAVGVSPNVNFLKESGITLGYGVQVNPYLETNIPGIYAIGDCAEVTEPESKHRPIEAVWYTGKMMGETVARTISGQPTPYQPGPWFNSAKFLDIEYQTYGWVSPTPPADEAHFYWEHHSGKKCITIAYNPSTRHFLGINTLGIRLRHAFFDSALRHGRHIDFVMEHLHEANFDPEFYQCHEQEIRKAFITHLTKSAQHVQ